MFTDSRAQKAARMMRPVRTSAVKRFDGRCTANGFDAVAHRTGPAWFLGSTPVASGTHSSKTSGLRSAATAKQATGVTGDSAARAILDRPAHPIESRSDDRAPSARQRDGRWSHWRAWQERSRVIASTHGAVVAWRQ